MSPVSAVAHLLALVAGVVGGLYLIAAVTPDLPGEETEPGVVAEEQVRGGDPDSLFRAAPLDGALDQLSSQLAAGDRVVSLRIEPGELNAESGSGGLDLDPDEIPPSAPERIVAAIPKARRAAGGDRAKIGLDDVQYLELRPGPRGPRWYVQLDLSIDPPRAFRAALEGGSVRPG